ncbi:hypothetical protein PhCBS80983_g00313 [Powellomyces hirtus]|uniref:Uncharacterized protein n=1 Tax=Powellomyces hirtus TaxID=109895 RepID=A0A507EFH1_9FUNG|nr:hypothetical protein PhCBS80983_g00313 [Powellomyces hirtus]
MASAMSTQMPCHVRLVCARCFRNVPRLSSASITSQVRFASSKSKRRPPAVIVHGSRQRENPKDKLGAADDYTFFGNVHHLGEGGRALVYTGSLNRWLGNFRYVAGATSAVSIVALPWLVSASVIPLEQTVSLVGVAGSLPWLAIYLLSNNYVTRLYRYPLAKGQPLSSQVLALETATLFGKVRETKVLISNLRYNPRWVNRVWQTAPDENGRTRDFFVDPKVVRDDPLLGQMWKQIQRQSPPTTSNSWFHRSSESDPLQKEKDI